MAERCPFCGFQNESGSEFCHFCNATLEKRPKHRPEPKAPAKVQQHVREVKYCKYCGGSIIVGSEQCPHCGKSLIKHDDHHETARREERGAEPNLGHYCAACRIFWPETMAFCQKCGATIDPKLIQKSSSSDSSTIVICPNCGTKNARREAYCCTCAAPLRVQRRD